MRGKPAQGMLMVGLRGVGKPFYQANAQDVAAMNAIPFTLKP